MKDYYYLLGLKRECTQEEIKRAYRKLSNKFHPDKNNGDDYFKERFQDIQEAYEVLSDVLKKRAYDDSYKFDSYTKRREAYKEVRDPIIEVFVADKFEIYDDEIVTFSWKVLYADYLFLSVRKDELLHNQGSKSIKVSNLRDKEKINITLVAKNSITGKEYTKDIELFSKLYKDIKNKIENEEKVKYNKEGSFKKTNTKNHNEANSPKEKSSQIDNSDNTTKIVMLLSVILIGFIGYQSIKSRYNKGDTHTWVKPQHTTSSKDELLRQIWQDNFSKVGTFEDFRSDFQNPSTRKGIWQDNFSGVVSFEEFESDLGYSSLPQSTLPQSSLPQNKSLSQLFVESFGSGVIVNSTVVKVPPSSNFFKSVDDNYYINIVSSHEVPFNNQLYFILNFENVYFDPEYNAYGVGECHACYGISGYLATTNYGKLFFNPKLRKGPGYGINGIDESFIHHVFKDIEVQNLKAGFPSFTFIDTLSEGLHRVIKNDLYGFINSNGQIVIDPTYKLAYNFNSGLARIIKNKKTGFINKVGIEVILCEFDFATDFDRYGYAVVNNGGRNWLSYGNSEIFGEGRNGIINTKGEIILDLNFDYIGMYYFPKLELTLGGNFYGPYIDGFWEGGTVIDFDLFDQVSRNINKMPLTSSQLNEIREGKNIDIYLKKINNDEYNIHYFINNSPIGNGIPDYELNVQKEKWSSVSQPINTPIGTIFVEESSTSKIQVSVEQPDYYFIPTKEQVEIFGSSFLPERRIVVKNGNKKSELPIITGAPDSSMIVCYKCCVDELNYLIHNNLLFFKCGGKLWKFNFKTEAVKLIAWCHLYRIIDTGIYRNNIYLETDRIKFNPINNKSEGRHEFFRIVDTEGNELVGSFNKSEIRDKF